MNSIQSWLRRSSLTLITLCSITAPAIAQVQGAGETTVLPIGNQIEIFNGTVAGNNLFHSFQEFSLSAEQTAVFQRIPPNTTNIFAQVLGGNVSNIDGTIQIERGIAANLYFMNPAGIIFGPNSSLNLPASFVGTTASGIDFGNGVFDRNNLEAKWTGLPQRLLFSPGEPGAIVNLSKSQSQITSNLALIGGTVYSTTPLSLPDGTISAVTTNGNTAVRIGIEGNLLSFDVDPNRLNQPTLPFTPATLAELITGNTLPSGQIYLDDVTVRSDCPTCPTRITLKSRDAIYAGDLTTTNNGATDLQANGNITVESIYTGDVGLNVYAGGVVQVTGAVKIASDVTASQLPVSIRSGGPIDIRHNAATISGQSIKGASISGNGNPFLIGPSNTGQLQPLSPGTSGTGGAIAISRFNDTGGGIPAIFQAQIFGVGVEGTEPINAGSSVVVSDSIVSGSDSSGISDTGRSVSPSSPSPNTALPVSDRSCRNTQKSPANSQSTQLIAQNRGGSEVAGDGPTDCGAAASESEAILEILESNLRSP